MDVLVTGATGFVGGRLTRLLSDEGLSPRALVRATSDTAALERASVPTFVADLGTGQGLSEALEGVDAVIHCAGGGRIRCTDDLYRNNTQTTVMLLEAISAHCPGLQRFVLLSSYAAHGPSNDPAPRGPEDPPRPRSHYGRSKLLAEEATLAQGGDLPVTILRSPGIYGPGDTRLLPLFRGVQRGLVVVPSSSGLASWLHVDDCCRAMLDALTRPHQSGRIFLVEDGAPRSVDEVVQSISRVMNLNPRVLHAPPWVMYLAALGSELWGRMTQRPALLTRDKLRDLRIPYWLGDTRRTTEELGWRPQQDFHEGVREMVLWFHERGLLGPTKAAV